MITRRKFLTATGGTVAALVLPVPQLLAIARRTTASTLELYAPSQVRGINVHIVNAMSLRLLRELGFSSVRYTLYWGAWTDTRPANDGTKRTIGDATRDAYLAGVDALRGAGIEVLTVVHTPPGGMSLAQGIAALPGFLAARAKERPGTIWQIMNEMDGNDGFNGGWFHASAKGMSQSQRGTLYGTLLAPVHDAIKRADPSARVVTGGIALEPTAFYSGLRASAGGKYDAVCVHCYGSPVAGVYRSKSIGMRPLLGRIPLWCTEWGNSSTDDAAQATDIAAALDDDARNDRYDRNYLYALMTDAAHGDTYGIVRSDGTRRTAAIAIEARRGRAAP